MDCYEQKNDKVSYKDYEATKKTMDKQIVIEKYIYSIKWKNSK